MEKSAALGAIAGSVTLGTASHLIQNIATPIFLKSKLMEDMARIHFQHGASNIPVPHKTKIIEGVASSVFPDVAYINKQFEDFGRTASKRTGKNILFGTLGVKENIQKNLPRVGINLPKTNVQESIVGNLISKAIRKPTFTDATRLAETQRKQVLSKHKIPSKLTGYVSEAIPYVGLVAGVGDMVTPSVSLSKKMLYSDKLKEMIPGIKKPQEYLRRKLLTDPIKKTVSKAMKGEYTHGIREKAMGVAINPLYADLSHAIGKDIQSGREKLLGIKSKIKVPKRPSKPSISKIIPAEALPKIRIGL